MSKTLCTIEPGVYLLDNGKYVVRAQHQGRRVNRVVTTLDLARSTLAAWYRRFEADEVEAVSGNSLLELGPAYLRSRKGRDQRNPRSRWDNHVARAPFAARHIGTIEPADILDWIDPLDLSKTTKRHLLNLVRAFFGWCLGRRLISSNPCAGLSLSAEDGDEEEGWQPGWYLDPDDQANLLAAVDDDEARRMVTIALYTGLRLGELLCLHVEHVHADVIEVHFGSWDPKKERYRPPKGKPGSNRTRRVPLFGPARYAVAEQLAELERRRAAGERATGPKLRRRSQNPLGLLFPSRWGGRRTKPPKAFLEAAKRVRVARLCGRSPWWHLLRHTYCTSRLAGWWGERADIYEVQTHAGHASIATTQRYAKVVDETIRTQAAEAHAAWETVRLGGNKVATAHALWAGQMLDFTGHSPQESNLQPAASKAYPQPHFLGDFAHSCHAVATCEAALRAVQSGDPTALARCVEAIRVCLGVLLPAQLGSATKTEAG